MHSSRAVLVIDNVFPRTMGFFNLVVHGQNAVLSVFAQVAALFLGEFCVKSGRGFE